MANGTHINTYIEEAEAAYKEAASALGNFYDKVEQLKGKFAQHIAEVAQAVGQTVPEIEALVPSLKPELDKVETLAEEAESVVNQVTQGAAKDEGKDKAKS